MSYRLPDSAHTSQPWRIHEIAPDFRLEDVWRLPGHGEAGDFPRLVNVIASFDPERSSSSAVRALFALRWKIGGLLGWDDAETGVGERVATLRDRLPADLRERPAPAHETLPFAPLYLTDDEWAAEIANGTMHGILHLGAVPDGDGGFAAQMAVLVKPNGVLGSAYMAAIAPFRHLVVYPHMIREGAAAWEAELARGGAPAPA